jgi:hypothetical protein
METRSCRIIHGTIFWLATIGKTIATLGHADPIEHWWTIFTTNKRNYYVLQFYQDSIYTLCKCGS